MIDITKTNETFTSINGTTVRLSELFAGIQSKVAYYAANKLITWDDADDLVMDSVYKALKCTGRYDETRTCKDGKPMTARRFGAMIAQSVVYSAVKKNSVLLDEEDDLYDDSDKSKEARQSDKADKPEKPEYVRRMVSWNDNIHAACYDARHHDGAYDAERDLLAEEKMEALEEAMASVSETDRTLLEMAGDDKKPAEMAEVVGLTPNATYSRLCRARKVVKSRYTSLMAA